MNEWDRKMAEMQRDQEQARKAENERRSSEVELGRWFAHKARGVPLQSCAVSVTWRVAGKGPYGGHETRSVSKPIAAWIVILLPPTETFHAIHKGSYIFVTPEGQSANCNQHGDSNRDLSLSGTIPEMPEKMLQSALSDGVSLYHSNELMKWLLDHGIEPSGSL